VSTSNEPKIWLFEITSELAGMRLDRALTNDPNIESRSQATRMIDLGFVELNGKKIKPSHKTSVGEVFSITLPPVTKRDLVPLDLKLDIVFEDEHLMVVNKPAGLVVHPAAGHWQDTLVNALLHHTNKLSGGFEADRPGIVHRLDKDTSGLIVVAKSDSIHRALAKQFKKKMVHRIYWAVVFGKMKPDSGTITSHLARHPNDRKRFASEKVIKGEEPTGKLAITHYTVKQILPAGLTLVHLKLETGRTHQIRVHMSEKGHAIVADPIYSSDGRIKSVNSVTLRKTLESFPRLALHAAELGFIHPRTSQTLKFFSPWPNEISSYVEQLGFQI
jgi:23S rRNA pseudouridine1911/1915/1917 synthase